MKKIVYTLGALAAVVTPVVAVVSCGSKGNVGVSNAGNSYPNEDWFDNIANNKIENNKIENGKYLGDLIDNGEGLGLRFKFATDDTTITGASDFNSPEMKALAESAVDKFIDANAVALKDHFKFFYIQIIDTKNFVMKATPSTYLPHVSLNSGETEDVWKTRAKAIYLRLMTDQKLSSSTKDIPITAYNAPSQFNMGLNVEKTDMGIARIFTTGQRYPQLENGKLSKDVITKFLSATLKAPSVSGSEDGVLGDYETEYHMSFANELYLSEINSALHIYRDAFPTWLVRDSSYVTNSATNGFKVPYAHLPQNPMDYTRMLADLSTTLGGVNFVKADANTYLEWNDTTNNYTLYTSLDTPFNASATGKLNDDVARNIAKTYLANDYVRTQSKYTNFVTSLSVNDDYASSKKIEAIKSALTSATNPYQFILDGDYKVRAKASVSIGTGSDVTTIDSYYPIKDVKQTYEWANNFDLTDVRKNDTNETKLTPDEKVIYSALNQLASEWWSKGSTIDPNGDLQFSEIVTSLKKDDNTKTSDDFAIQQLLEWALKDAIQKTFAKWSYSATNKVVYFTINENTTEDSLTQQLKDFDFLTVDEVSAAYAQAQAQSQPQPANP